MEKWSNSLVDGRINRLMDGWKRLFFVETSLLLLQTIQQQSYVQAMGLM